MVKNEEKEGGKVYEIGYLLVPSLSHEEAAAEAAKLRDLVARHEGTVVTDDEPKLRDLAYSMAKVTGHKKEIFGNAYFGWVKFNLAAAALSVMRKELEKNDKLVRFLLIETVRENTIASRRPVTGNGGTSRRRDPKGEGMSEEEIDKTIEALVAE